ncbi:tetratricopeptide (TPR) repeat protein [Rhodoligotrophos appendicifer]|uniref:hypothetical protein n=1 Tax=Rhodoligotrophos appendicifer TaxID=987056 RepID=UPI001184FA9C|nr:hypothetical protein [Rhodoligotrophos appendicifer]
MLDASIAEAADPSNTAPALAAAARAVYWQPANRDAQLRYATLLLSKYDQEEESDNPQASSTLATALEAYARAVQLAPGSPNAWLQMARLYRAAEDSDRTVAALRASYLTGPREGWLSSDRTPLALALWAELDPESRAMVQRELRFQTPRMLASLYLTAPEGSKEAVVSEAETRPDNEQEIFLRTMERLVPAD